MDRLARALVAAALLGVATISPVKAETSFLEAALFFITGVDTTDEDTVTDREIRLSRYPIVAYLADSNPCAVRLRATTQPTIWQLDFCKITGYRLWGQRSAIWYGYKTAFCTYRGSDANTNYVGPIDEQNSQCGLGASDPEIVWSFDYHIGTLFNRTQTQYWRSLERMMGAFKYVVMLLTGKPY
jgi:hypothetical protein